MIQTEDAQTINPICPHCNLEINKVLTQELVVTFGRSFIYFCPHCKKVLGTSLRKGFFMG